MTRLQVSRWALADGLQRIPVLNLGLTTNGTYFVDLEVAEVAKTFGISSVSAQSLGEFRYKVNAIGMFAISIDLSISSK